MVLLFFFCCLGSRFPFLSLRDLGTCSAMEMCNVASAARCDPCRGMETEGFGEPLPWIWEGAALAMGFPWGTALSCPRLMEKRS